MKKTFVLVFAANLLILFLSSCEKAKFEVISNFNVRLASNSFAAEQFNIQLKQVKVNLNDSTWIDLNTPAHTYNVLNFQNGSDTIVATGQLPATSIVKQLKVVFSSTVSIKLTDKETLVPIASESEVILQVGRKLNRNIENFKIQFEPAGSLILNSDGNYIFKPALSIIN